TPGFSTSGWLSVTNDGAGAPGTEINALLQNGSCPNVFFSTNMKNCFGQMTKVGADTIAQFSVPWWYRTDFAAPPAGQNAKLIVNGVVGKADVWVNGAQIATSDTVAGAYARRVFDITSRLVAGTNSSATAQTGTVSATITPPSGTATTVSQTVTVPANSTQTVSFAPITITGPQLWWPYRLGAQPLYTLATSVAQNGTVLNSTSETF